MKSYIKNNPLITFVFLSFIMILANKTVIYAASANVTLSSKVTEIEEGETFTVDINLNSLESIGDFEGYLTYDTKTLEFVSESSFIAGGEGLIKISDINVMSGETTKKYVVKFKAIETGTSLISFRENPAVYEFSTGLSMSISSNQFTVNVKNKATVSDNGELKELKITPGSLTPEFSTDMKEYTVKVENDVNQMIISALPSDEKASVTVMGNEVLVEGDNAIHIIVEAESGTKTEYKVTVLKEAADSTKDSENQNEMDNNQEETDEYTINNTAAFISSPQIIKEDGNVFFQNGYRYELISVDQDVIIPEGYVRTSIVIDNTQVEVYSLEGDPYSEFLLIYAIGPTGNQGFYLYDRLENTFQRYHGVITKDQQKDDNSNKIVERLESRITIMGVLLFVFIAVFIIMVLHLFQNHSSQKRRKRK